jgi:uncharacterized membrane protein
MLQLPPIPSWDALHPLIIHFPIALLLIAPAFIIIGALLQPPKGRPYLVAAMVLLLAGTVAIYVAIETGEAAGKLAERTPGVEQVIETHESLAERTRTVFTVLSVIFVALLVMPRLLKKDDTRLTSTILPLAFLVLYGAGALLLVNTAHNGGRLVHEFGVRAIVASSPANANTTMPVNAEPEND